jgi:hypothetical protein
LVEKNGVGTPIYLASFAAKNQRTGIIPLVGEKRIPTV